MPPIDEELLNKAVGGDADALGELLAQCGKGIRTALVKSIAPQWRSLLDADDVLQVTYLDAFLRIRSFKPSGVASFISWLRQSAENNLRDGIRGLSRQKRPDPRKKAWIQVGEDSVLALYDLAGGDSSTPSRVAGRREIAGIIEAALRRLPPDYERVLRHYDLDELPVADVAAALDRSSGAVFMLRARALDRLRELLPEVTALFSDSP